jgi:intracellular sulfur oxidation DsrE/DsrF family protein
VTAAAVIASEATGKVEEREILIAPDAIVVPLGVVQLMVLQQQGWRYVQP